MLDLVDHNGALKTGVLRDSAHRSLQGLADDVNANLLVSIGNFQLVKRRDSVDKCNAAASNDALFNSSARSLQSVLDTGLLLLQLGLGGSANLQYSNATGQLGQALLQLLAVEVGVNALKLVLDLVDAVLDGGLVASAVNDQRGVLGDLDGLSGAQHLDLGVGQRHAEVLVDDLCAGNGSDVLQDALTTIAEARSLNSNSGERATQLVQQDGCQSLALNVLSNDEQRTAGLHDLLQQRHHVLNVGDLLVGQQDVRIGQVCFHLLHVGGHVGANVAAVVLHAFHDVHVQAERLGILNGNGTVLAHSVHGLSDLRANLSVASGNGANVGDLLGGGNRGSVGLDGLNHGVGCLLNAAADAQRVSASGYVAQALGHDDVGQKRCGGGAVTSNVVGFHSSLADKLSAHVLDRVLKLNFLSDGNTIVGNQRSAEGLLQGNVTALGAQRYLNGVCQLVDACSKSGAGISLELDILSHAWSSFRMRLARPTCQAQTPCVLIR